MQEKEYNWYERGELPPIGVDCEINFGHGKTPEWYVGTVVYRSDKFAIIIYSDGKEVCYDADELDCVAYRPIKTDREKAIDAAIAAMQPNALTGTMSIWFGRLYDAGLLRLPEQK